MNKIYVLGIGPGDKDYLLPKTEKIVKNSDILIGGRRALAIFSKLEKETLKITSDLDSIRDYIRENYQTKTISVLVSGDPGFYSMLNYLKNHFARQLLEVVPGISALQLAAARASLSWDDMKITSLHGKDDREKFLQEVRKNSKVGLFTDQKFPPDRIAAYLLRQGIDRKKAVVFENLSYPDEEMTEGSLQKIKENNYAELTVMVILDEKMAI